MARRNDHSREELKDMLFQSAWTIIGEEGVEAISARRLAKEIGYAPGTIYNIYESMDDLYLHINGRTLDDLYQILSSRFCNDPKRSAAENLRKMANLYMQFARERRHYWLLLFRVELPEERKQVPWYQEKFDLLFAPLETLLKEYFLDDTEARTISARILWSSIHGLCFLQESGKIPLISGEVRTKDMVDRLIQTYLDGMKV